MYLRAGFLSGRNTDRLVACTPGKSHRWNHFHETPYQNCLIVRSIVGSCGS